MPAKPKVNGRKPAPRTPPPAAEFDLDALLDSARLPEREVALCLRGDLYAEVERLDTELQTVIARFGDEGRLSGNPEARALTEQIEAARARMSQHTMTVTLRALPRDEFTRIEAACPPRPNNEGDARTNVDTDKMTDMLLRASVIAPVMTEARWSKLLAVITDGQYDSLGNVVWALNRGEVSVPFSLAALKVLRSVSG